MQNDWLAKRVEMLENTVNGPDGLVPRVDRLHEGFDLLQGTVSEFRTEFLQFSGWTRNEFSAVRGEMADGFAAVRDEMATGFAAVRQEMADGNAALRQEMAEGNAALRQEMADGNAALRQELGEKIEAGDHETRQFMRVLYEDLVGRLTLLQEGLDRRGAS